MFFDPPVFATDFERIPRASRPWFRNHPRFGDAGIVGCTVVADDVEVIGEASNVVIVTRLVFYRTHARIVNNLL